MSAAHSSVPGGKQSGALNLLSPQRLIMLSGVVLLAFTLVPPGFYRALINERNFMFANAELCLFVIGCLTIIYVGTVVGAGVRFSKGRPLPRLVTVSPFAYLLMPVSVALTMVVATIAILLKNEPWLLATALVGDGQEVKNLMATATQGAMTGSLPLAMGICWWGYAQFLSMRLDMTRFNRVFSGVLIAALTGFLFLAFGLTLARYLLMPLLFGMFLLRTRAKLAEGEKVRKLILPALGFAVLVLILFGLIAAMRNRSAHSGVLGSFVGYGPTSMNHLAAMIDGRMDSRLLQDYFDTMNFGFYYKFPFLERFYDLNGLYEQAHDAPFNVTWRAGLNGSYIWITSLGEIGFGLGFFSIIYFFLYGVIVGKAWSAFKEGGTFGSIMYPWSAFCILFAFGSNYFAGRNLSILLISCGILWLYAGLVRPRKLA